MLPNHMKCPRCIGRKKVYRIMGNGYSLMNSGGVEITCPMCNGEGSVLTLEAATIDAIKKSKARKQKDDNNGVLIKRDSLNGNQTSS